MRGLAAAVDGHTTRMNSLLAALAPMAGGAGIDARRAPMVLLVDDEREALVVLENALVALGYRVTTAVNGADALDKAALVQPDIVVTDLLMPVVDGIALAKALRSNPLTSQTRIVMCSGVEEGRVRPLFNRYDAFLHKPYEIADLRTALSKLLHAPPG